MPDSAAVERVRSVRNSEQNCKMNISKRLF